MGKKKKAVLGNCNAVWSLPETWHYPVSLQFEGKNDQPCDSQKEKPLKQYQWNARMNGGWADKEALFKEVTLMAWIRDSVQETENRGECQYGAGTEGEMI